jgi:hypothetical protein
MVLAFHRTAEEEVSGQLCELHDARSEETDQVLIAE